MHFNGRTQCKQNKNAFSLNRDMGVIICKRKLFTICFQTSIHSSKTQVPSYKCPTESPRGKYVCVREIKRQIRKKIN